MQNLKEIFEQLGGDPYEILETAPNAELQILRKNYRLLAAKYHPDKNKEQNAKMIFIKINQAYQFLQSEANRKLYHSQIKAVEEQKKRMENMNEQRRRMAEDLKRRQQEYAQRQKDMEHQLKRRKQFYRKKMEEQQEKQKLKTEIASSIGSEKYYQLVSTCDIEWQEGLSFTEELIRMAFMSYGQITQISLQNKRNKASIKFNSIQDCTRTVQNFKHPLISITYHVQKSKRDQLLKALTIQKNKKIDLSLNSDNIARIKQIMNRNSSLYIRDRKEMFID